MSTNTITATITATTIAITATGTDLVSRIGSSSWLRSWFGSVMHGVVVVVRDVVNPMGSYRLAILPVLTDDLAAEKQVRCHHRRRQPRPLA